MTKKKIGTVALACLLTATTIVGCGGGTTVQKEMGGSSASSSSASGNSSASSGDAVEITWWTWSTEATDIYTKYAEMVHEKYPNITVNLQFMENGDYWKKLPIAIAGGTGPDIFQMTRPSFELFCASNQAMDLTDIIAGNSELKKNLDAMDPVLVNGYQFNGKQMAVPYSVESTAVVYNKDIFKKAGMTEPKDIEDTWTWTDLQEMAEKLTVKGDTAATSTYGFFCDVNKIPLWEMMLSRGKWVMSDDGNTCTISDPDIVDAITPLQVMYQEGVSPTTDVTQTMSANDLFMTGKIAMMAAGSWMLTTYSKIEGFEWDCAELPLDPVTKKRVSSSNMLGYVVNPNTKNTDAVSKVLEVFTSPEAQKELADSGTYIPAIVNSRDGYFTAEGYPANAKAFQRALEYVHPNFLTQYIPYAQFSTIQKTTMTNIYEGEDIAKALQEEQEQVQKIMDETKESFK